MHTLYIYIYIYIYISLFIEHNCDVSLEQNVIIHKSFSYSKYSLIRSIDRQLVNGNKNEIYKQEGVLTADCYSKHVNTLIPTFFISKLFNFGVPRSHAPETNAELAISAKQIISSMLATVPVIHETH